MTCKTLNLLPNDISTPVLAHPNLMNPPGIDVKSITNTKRLFRRALVLRVRDHQLAAEGKMCSQAGMGVRAVVRVGAI